MECKPLERRAVAVDINPDAVMVARNRLDFAFMHEMVVSDDFKHKYYNQTN